MKKLTVIVVSLTILFALLAGTAMAYEPWSPSEETDDSLEFIVELETLIEELSAAVDRAVQNRAASPDFLDDLQSLVVAFQALSVPTVEAPARDARTPRTLGPAVELFPSRTNLRNMDERLNQTLYIAVKGSSSGAVWGSDIYTADSQIAAAAVHAGLVAVDEHGIVGIRILPGQSRYNGSSRNGITTRDYGNYGLSYQFVSDGSDVTLFKDPGNLTAFTGLAGATFAFEVTGGTTGTVWGTDLYTTDSRLAAAAVHAGVLQPGQTGIVLVNLESGARNYQGSNRNGVSSRPWGSYPSSYRVAPLD